MRAWLHVLVLLALVLVFGASFVMLSRVIGITSPWLPMLLMFYFLGIAKVAEPLFVLRMPAALRRLRHWDRDGDVYRRLGVFSFGRWLRQSPLRYLNSGVYLAREHRQLRQVRLKAESSEASHFWAAVLIMPYVTFAGLSGMWNVVAWFLLAQILVNVYPILHLRHVRGRLDRAICRMDRKENGSS
jgi:hypothetical protein